MIISFENAAARELCKKLIQEERNHKAKLKVPMMISSTRKMNMVSNLTLHEVLKEAIQKEVLSRFLYVGLRQRVKNAGSKEAFHILAEQEEMHQRFLEDYLHGKIKEGALSPGLVVDYKIVDCLDQPEISPTMDIKEVFNLAVNREKASHDLYLNLAAIHPNGYIKHIMEDIAAQELEHKKHVESLYVEVAFPQTNGG
jgi:rubrerythrin